MNAPTVPLTLQPHAMDRPPRQERLGAGMALAVAAHLALVAGLTWSVRWHTDTGAAVEAELWSEVPQAAAPPTETPPAPVAPEPTPPPPPPPPVETPATVRPPDIVTERDTKVREREQHREQQEAEARRKEQLQQKQQQLKAQQDAQKKADAKAAKLRDEQMRRLQDMAKGDGSGSGGSGTAAHSSGPSAGYAGRIQARIKPNIRPIRDFPSGLKTDVELRLGPDGTILSRRVKASSGDPAWDDEALKAIDRTGVLPRDVDGSVPSTMIVTIKPDS